MDERSVGIDSTPKNKSFNQMSVDQYSDFDMSSNLSTKRYGKSILDLNKDRN